MSQQQPLRIEYVGDGGSHEDLVLTIGSHRHVADTYYLAIEEPSDADVDVRSRISALLARWVDDLGTMNEGGSAVLLPFDFSDQCTAWLEVRPSLDSRVEARLGWSGLEGWAVSPSNYAESLARVGMLDTIEGAIVTCELTDLIVAVEGCRAQIGLR